VIRKGALIKTGLNIGRLNRWALKLARDEALMKAYALGDPQAFEELYRRHKRGLFVFLRRQCPSATICEELAHDAWLAVIKQASNYQENAQFKTWLFRIAHNRLVDHWRKHGSGANVLFEELNDSITCSLNSSHASADSHIRLAELLSNLESLSAEQTEAVLLKIEGFSHAQIADITNTKQETVKSRLRYAAKNLRTSMEPV
jgi:RNA polymerase sigma-70 factor (ECF subfamily)